MNNSAIYLRKKNSVMFLFLAWSLVLGAYTIIQIINEPTGDLDWYFPIVFCSATWILFYLVAAWQSFRHIYLFSSAFLTALILFHLGLIYQRAFGSFMFPSSWEHGSFSPWLEKAGWHVILALSGFGIGFAIAVSTSKNHLRDSDPKLDYRVKKIGHWSAIGLLIASVIFFSFAIQSYGNLLNYARHEIFSSKADSRGFGAFMMIFPGSVLLYYFSATSKTQKLFGLFLATFAFLMFMISGYRSAALFPSLVGVALWVKSGRKLPLPIVAGGIVVVLMLIAVSGYLRTMGKYSELNLNDVSTSLDKSSIDSSISEMGASIKALASVLQLVPKMDGYRYGSSYLYSAVDALPNISGTINIEASREYVIKQKNSDPDAINHMHPADWLTYRIAPWDFSHGFGVGFSAIAEPYLNFGTFGVFFFFGILGYGLGKLDSIPLFQSPFILIFSASMLWPLIRTVRNDSSNFFKPFIFTLLILAAWWIFSKIFFRKRFKW
ncbi:MAG: O-antigen polysaccharide polymerase Wzy [Methylococcales bacterium]